MAVFGQNDKAFMSGGHYSKAVPGLRKAHLNLDISIVYKINGNIMYLYGFYKHDELGTGQPPNINKQSSMATQLANVSFFDPSA